MPILAGRRFEISSTPDPMSVARVLTERTHTQHGRFRWPRPEMLFAGDVNPQKFRMYPIRLGPGFYLPWIVGTIHHRNGGSVVGGKITMQSPKPALNEQ